MPITHEKGIEELDKMKKKPDSEKKTEPNENNVPDPEGKHPPMYS